MRLSPPIPVPKPKPAKLAKDQRRREREREDKAESAKVKARSGGRCEVRWAPASPPQSNIAYYIRRCMRRAVHVHHLLSGIGVRARGKSRLAEHKLHVCERCHREIHGHVLKRIGGPVPHYTDCYERVR